MPELLDAVLLLAAKKDPDGDKARELMESGNFYYQLGLTLAFVGIGIVVLGVVLMIVRDVQKKKKQQQQPPDPDAGGQDQEPGQRG